MTTDSKENPKNKPDINEKNVNVIIKLINSLIGGAIGIGITLLFGLVVLTFVVKSFLVSEEMVPQLLNTVVPIVGTSLGGVIGFFLGRTSDKERE